VLKINERVSRDVFLSELLAPLFMARVVPEPKTGFWFTYTGHKRVKGVVAAEFVPA